MTDVFGKDGLSRQWCNTALSTIIKLSNIIGYLPGDIHKTLNTVVEEIYTLFKPKICCVYLIQQNSSLEPVASRGLDGKMPDLHLEHAMEACVALRDGLPYVACQESVCPNRKIYGVPDYTHVCIPMITGRDVHGVISVTFPSERGLEKDELNVLLSITTQTSAAIQRYKLFEKLRNEKIEIERAYNQIKELNRMLESKIRELKRTQQRLIQSEKLAATGMLSAGLCHEINNPLSVILNRIECLKIESSETALPEQILKDLEVIYTNASKVSSIVQNLLIFARHHPVNFGYYRIRPLFERVISMFDSVLETGKYKINLDIAENQPPLYCDEERIEQVFRNILSNAFDAMPEGGSIYISSKVSALRQGFLEISIKDEGKGIPEEHIHKIFDPFFTTKSLGKGTGLGLSICYGIIKAHKGDIRVKSEPGMGAVFTVLLPYKKEVISK